MKSPIKHVLSAVALASAIACLPHTVMAEPVATKVAENGIVKVRSAYPFGETILRLKSDIAAKGIMFFSAIEQSKLAEKVGITLNPSTLLVFGNPPLGVQFLTANPDAGLDWPVRLLVSQDAKGQVWMTYTDFHYIARRHGIANRNEAFDMASKVIVSITSAAAVGTR